MRYISSLPVESSQLRQEKVAEITMKRKGAAFSGQAGSMPPGFGPTVAGRSALANSEPKRF